MLDGYYRNTALSEERLVGGWFATRDLGFLHGGHVYVLGRLDDVIIYRGRNIFAGDLEAALLGIPGLKPGRTVAFGVYAEGIGSEQVIILSETAEKSPGRDVLEGIEDMIRSRLQDRFGINPTQVVPMAPNSLRKTTSGKVSRVQNKQQFLRAAQLEQIKP
jgi:fatty-acyl-CoA synthase